MPRLHRIPAKGCGCAKNGVVWYRGTDLVCPKQQSTPTPYLGFLEVFSGSDECRTQEIHVADNFVDRARPNPP